MSESVSPGGHSSSGFSGAEKVWLQRSELVELLTAIETCVPAGTDYGFNIVGERAWILVSKPADTRQVVQAARDMIGDL